MKKKIIILGLVLILMFSLAGCGGSKEKVEFDQATLEASAEAIIGVFSSMDAETMESFRDMSEYQLNYLLMAQFPYVSSSKDFLTMMDAWEAGAKDCGTITDFGEFTMEVSEDEAVLKAPIKGESRDGEIEFVFDEKSIAQNITINANYSTGEILKKAGLNTILGMGTVFVVLIFISFIISLFKYIPAIQEKFSKKGKAAAPAAPTPKAAPAAPVVEAAAADDSELIAVIAAAIAAAEGTSTDGFIVRSIKRRKSNKWR